LSQITQHKEHHASSLPSVTSEAACASNTTLVPHKAQAVYPKDWQPLHKLQHKCSSPLVPHAEFNWLASLTVHPETTYVYVVLHPLHSHLLKVSPKEGNQNNDLTRHLFFTLQLLSPHTGREAAAAVPVSQAAR